MGKIKPELFSEELEDAGLIGLPFSFSEDAVFFPEKNGPTKAQQDAINSIVANHDPTRQTRVEIRDATRDARIDAFIDTNGTNLAGLRTILKRLLKKQKLELE